MAKNNNTNKIPNQNNIFSIYSSMSEDMGKLIKNVVDNGLKMTDLVKLKVNMKITKMAVKQIFKGYAEIQAILSTQEANQTISLITNIVTDPVKFVKSINSGKIDLKESKQNGSIKVLDEYLKLVKILSDISAYSNNISLKGLSKLPKIADRSIDLLIKSLKVIKKKANKIEPISIAIDNALKVVPNTFGVLTTLSYNLDSFIKMSKKWKRKKIRNAINKFFIGYVFIAEDMFKIGKFLVTGEYTYEDPTLYGLKRNKTTIKYNPVFLWIGIVLANKFIKFAIELVKSTRPLINTLIKVGQNKDVIADGLQSLEFIFIGGSNKKNIVHGLPWIISNTGGFNLVKSVLFLAFTSLMVPILAESVIISTALAMIGQNKKDIKKGIKTFKIIFDPNNVKSFISIISEASNYIDGKAIGSIAIFIGYLLIANIAMMLATMLAQNLGLFGSYKKAIKRGLKALNYMLFGNTPGVVGKTFGKKEKLGLIALISNTVSNEIILKETIVFITLGLLYIVTFEVYKKVAQSLFTIGTLSKKMKKGIKALNYTLFGSLGPISGIEGFKKNDKLGLIDIAHYLRINGVIGDALYFTLYSAILSIVFNKFQTVVDTIVDLGSNKRKAIRGIKALNVILFGKGKHYKGIVDILKDERIKELTIKDILVVGVKMVMVSAVFLAVGTIISILGILGLAAPIAMLVMISINVVIRKMIKGLNRIKEVDFDIKAEAKKLMEMGTAYIQFIKLFNFALKDVTPKDFLKTLFIIYISPIVIRRMIRGLRILEKKSKGLNIQSSSVAISQMCIAYIGLAKSLQVIGTTINLGVILISVGFFMIAPIVIKIMSWTFRVLNNPKIKALVVSGSVVLSVMSLAMVGFAGALVTISLILTGANIMMLLPFIGLIAIMGLVFAAVGALSPFILLGSLAMIAMAGALFILSIAIVIFSAAIIVFALSFQILRAIMPSDDVIEEVVTGVIKMIKGIGDILRAINANISIGAAVKGFASMLIMIFTLAFLTINALLFILLGAITSAITQEMIISVINFVHAQSTIVRELVSNFNLKDMFLALVASAFYMVITILLTIDAIFAIILYGITSIIDYTKFRQNLGLDEKNGLIPIMSDTVKLIKKSLRIIPITKAIIKITLLLALVGALCGIALAVKSIASLEISEYDSNGHPTGKKVKMQKSDFDSAKENIENLVTTVVSIFFDKDGKPTKTMELIKSIKGKVVMQTMGLKIILASISGMAKVVANMSKLVVPDEEKGFNDKGKPLGWRQLSKGDFEKFKENTSELAGVITSLFDDNTPEGIAFTNALDRVKISSTIKMKLIGSIIKTFGDMAGIIAKMSVLVVPDVNLEDPNDRSYIDPKTGTITKWRKLTSGDIDAASANMVSLMTIIGTIIDKIKDSDLENIKMKTFKKFEKVMSGISPITDLVDTVIKLATGQFPMIMLQSNGEPEKDSKGNIKMVYKSFNEIPFDTAVANISTIVKKYLYGIGKIFSDKYYQNRIADINKHMKEGIATGGISDIVDQVIKLATGQFPLMVLDKTTGEPLKDKNGNIRMKYVALDSTMITQATSNIGTIISSYVEGLAEIINAPDNNFVQKLNDVNAAFTGSSGLFTLLTPMIDNVTKISDIGDKKIDSFTKNMQNIVFGYNTAIISINDNIDNYKLWETVRDPFNDFVNTSSNLYSELKDNAIPTNIEKSVNSTNKFLAQVNGMNTNKLNKMADISGNMAKFSTSIRGNFDSLAKAMNENIITALDKVDKSLKELKDFLEDDFTNKLSTGVSDAVGNITVKTDGNKEKPEPIVKKRSDVADKAPDNKTQKQATQQKDNKENLNTLIRELLQCINGDKTINVTNS